MPFFPLNFQVLFVKITLHLHSSSQREHIGASETICNILKKPRQVNSVLLYLDWEKI